MRLDKNTSLKTGLTEGTVSCGRVTAANTLCTIARPCKSYDKQRWKKKGR